MALDQLHIEPDWQEALAAAGLGAFDGLMECQLGRCVSEHGRGQVRRIELPGGEVVFLKRDSFGLTMLKDALLDLCRLRKPLAPAIKEVNAIMRVGRLGIRVPEPIAWGQESLGPLPMQSVLVTAELPGRHLHTMLKHGASRDELRPALAAAGRAAGMIYRAGLSWPDLMPKHFFIDGDSAAVLDLIRIHKAKKPLSAYMPAQVARFCDKARFLGAEADDVALFLEAMAYERLLAGARDA